MSVFGGDLFGATGSVASPFYPRDYPNDVSYTWTVTVDLGFRVMATFQTMDVEGPWRGNCAYDYVRVYTLAGGRAAVLPLCRFIWQRFDQSTDRSVDWYSQHCC